MILMIFLSVQLAQSQDRGEMFKKIEAQKVGFLTSELELTPDEAMDFWPVYNAYQAEHRALREFGKKDLRGKEITDDEALKIIDRLFEIQEKELLLQKQLYQDLEGIISPTKKVRLHIAEKKFKQRLLERVKNHKGKKEQRR